ncbi:MAG: hypothetical protein EP343_26240 [Deltaproteobacteria bacterium]|nr:MAG: hypothetical protein EP343_26240 [Deltaproteobacteria bacterium]
MTENTPYVGQLHPPTTERVSQLVPASVSIKLKKLVFLLFGGAVIFGVLYFLGSLFSAGWLQTTGYVLGGLCIPLSIWIGLTAKVAPCPYCDGVVGAGAYDTIAMDDEAEQMECEHCFELLLTENGTVRALTEDNTPKPGSFTVSVVANGHWPEECIVCGAPPTHFDAVKKNKLEVEKLLLGSLSVQSGKIDGVPYCDQHGDAVSLAISDDKLKVVFPELAMARRYLAVNPVRLPVEVKS